MRPARLEQISFADLELERQGVGLDPELRAVADLLGGCPGLDDLVRADLLRGLRPGRGRPGLPAACTLRSLVLWRMKDCTYRDLRERIADGHGLREFVGLRSAKVPRHDAFQRAFSRLRPQTVREINDRLLRHAVEQELIEASKLRIDATVVESNIRYPTDAGLLADTVRVLTRLVHGLGQSCPAALEGFHDRVRRTKKRAYEIHRIPRGRHEARRRRKYRELLGLTEEVIASAAASADRVEASPPQDGLAAAAARFLVQEIRHFRSLGLRVVDQARRRVLEGENVPAAEKVVSIFEPHTSIIVRGKARQPVEFGHKLFLAEIAEGVIVRWEVVDGAPPDSPWVTVALTKHRELFGRVPEVYAGDRGFYTGDNVELCESAGIATESFPYKGPTRPRQRTAHEHTSAFRDAQRFRAGVEGRISVLARGRGLDRCPLRGRERFDLFVAAAILANNLKKLAAAVLARDAKTANEHADPAPARAA